jgi:hypothetical protein
MISTEEEKNWASEGDQLLEGDFLKPYFYETLSPSRTSKNKEEAGISKYLDEIVNFGVVANHGVTPAATISQLIGPYSLP